MSESARLARLISQMREATVCASIRRARAISKTCDGPGCSDASGNFLTQTPRESDLLQTRINNDFTAFVGRTVETESARIQGIIITTYGNSIDEFNPLTRFAEYAPRVVPPVCPPVPLIDRNANLPKSSTKCPLPNKPYFPSFY